MEEDQLKLPTKKLFRKPLPNKKPTIPVPQPPPTSNPSEKSLKSKFWAGLIREEPLQSKVNLNDHLKTEMDRVDTSWSLEYGHPPSRIELIPSNQDLNEEEEDQDKTMVTFEDIKIREESPRWQKRFILDKNITPSSSKSTRASKRILQKNYKPRGPDPLPIKLGPRHNLPHTSSLPEWFSNEGIITEKSPPLFTLNNFLIDIAEKERIPLDVVKKSVLSSHNFKRITNMIADQLQPKHTMMTFINLDEEIKDSLPTSNARVPSKQFLLEMAALIREELIQTTGYQVECAIVPLPKYTPNYPLGKAPHTEIVLYDKGRGHDLLATYTQFDNVSHHPQRENLFSASGSRQFINGKRSDSPFTFGENEITPSEVCVLECLMNGGIILSLKANFINTLPDITSLYPTLTYINISYNDFRELPKELLQITHLQTLKARNNPLRELPLNIHEMTNLRLLDVSHCLLTMVPLSLYSLNKLKFLDLSYNRLNNLHSEIRQLRNLEELYVDGNELFALPNGIQRLALKRIGVKNNFLHPLLWNEAARNEPQRLEHLAALSFVRSGFIQLYAGFEEDSEEQANEMKRPSLPEEAIKTLKGAIECECCGDIMFGPGLRIIRPCRQIFGIKYLPILFKCCASFCQKNFINNDDPDKFYGNDNNNEEKMKTMRNQDNSSVLEE